MGGPRRLGNGQAGWDAGRKGEPGWLVGTTGTGPWTRHSHHHGRLGPPSAPPPLSRRGAGRGRWAVLVRPADVLPIKKKESVYGGHKQRGNPNSGQNRGWFASSNST